jgi:hypothetical protein
MVVASTQAHAVRKVHRYKFCSWWCNSLAEKLSASQEGLCSMELVSWCNSNHNALNRLKFCCRFCECSLLPSVDAVLLFIHTHTYVYTHIHTSTLPHYRTCHIIAGYKLHALVLVDRYRNPSVWARDQSASSSLSVGLYSIGEHATPLAVILNILKPSGNFTYHQV